MTHWDKPTPGGAYIAAVCFILLATSLMAVAFGTSYWMDYYVDREGLRAVGVPLVVMNSPVFYTRHRGLFVTCYPKQASFLDQPGFTERLRDGHCLVETGYEVPVRNPRTVVYSYYYEIRIHLMRCHFAAMLLSLVFLFASIVTSLLGFWNRSTRLTRQTAILAFVAMFFAGASTAFFHCYIYLEVNYLSELPYTPAWVDKQSANVGIYTKLAMYSRMQYGYSYILVWLALIAMVAVSVLFFIMADKHATYRRMKLPDRSSYRYEERRIVKEHEKHPVVDRADSAYVQKSIGSKDGQVSPSLPGLFYFESSPYDFGGSYKY